jgi:hypothetical protein
MHLLDALPLKLNSHFFAVNRIGRSNELILEEAYKIAGKTMVRQAYGRWLTAEERLEIDVANTWERRRDLRGVKLVDSVLPWPGLNVEDPTQPSGFSGLMAESFAAMQKIANFTAVVTPPPDGEWGAPAADGSGWTGIVGELMSGRAQVSSGGLAFTLRRNRVIRFTDALAQDKVTLIAPNLNEAEGVDGSGVNDRNLDKFAFARILHPWTWAAVATLGALVASSYALIGQEDRRRGLLGQGLRGFLRGAGDYASALCQKTGDADRESRWALRTTILTLNLFSFFLYTAYTSQLTASFASERAAAEPRSFEEVLALRRRVAFSATSAEAEIVAAASPLSALARVHADPDLSSKHTELGEMKTKAWAAGEYLYSFVSGVVGDRRFRPVDVFREQRSLPLALALPLHSEMAELLDHLSLRLRQAGVLDRLATRWERQAGAVDAAAEIKAGESEPGSLGPASFVLPAIACAVGAVGALVTLIIERLTGGSGSSSVAKYCHNQPSFAASQSLVVLPPSYRSTGLGRHSFSKKTSSGLATPAAGNAPRFSDRARVAGGFGGDDGEDERDTFHF